MKYLILCLFSTVALSQSTQTVNWLGGQGGKSCQICTESGSIKVCKFYKRCPVKKERKRD